jgi:hypothetical protein
LKGDGKVGVGTGSPASTLDVAGDVAMTSLNMTGQLQIQNDTPTITLRDTNGRTGYIHQNSDIMYFLGGSNNSPHGSWTQVNSQWHLMLNLANNAATFGGVVSTAGSISATGSVSAASFSATGNGIFNMNFCGNVGFGTDWAGFSHKDKANTTQYALLHNGTNGQTILNTTSGQDCLFRQNNSTYGWGNSGGIAMNGYFSTSDSNNKENIKPLGRLLDKLDKIEGKSFEWKQGKTKIKHKEGKHIGLLAQDLQKLCPEVVSENAAGLCYELTAFNGVVIQLLKDLKNEIDDFKEQLKKKP